MPNRETSPTSGQNRKIETPERSTTPEGDPPRIRDFATGYISSGVSAHSKDFASGYGLLQKGWDDAGKQGLQGKHRVLEPPDDSYECHDLTFFDGRNNAVASKIDINDHFKILGSKIAFQKNSSLYDKLTEKLRNNKDSCIAIYVVSGEIIHTSPIEEVYQKENGKRSIKLWGKWGKKGPLVMHDIEDVPSRYRTKQNKTNWYIYFTDRENGRIMDL